jgi:trehalose-6-phosphate synthase
MRITLRLILSLVLGITLVASLFDLLQVQQEKRRLREDLERRAAVLAENLGQTVERQLEKQGTGKVQGIVDTLGKRERLSGVAIYDAAGHSQAITSGLAELPQFPAMALEAVQTGHGLGQFQTVNGKLMHIYALPLKRQETVDGALVLLHDASYISGLTAGTWRLNFIRLLMQTLLIALVTLLIVRWSIAGPIAKTAEWMKRLRRGETPEQAGLPRKGLFEPLAQEVIHLTKSLSAARAAAEQEAQLREAGDSLWTPERLKEHVRITLRGQPVFVISNREPYVHIRKGKSIQYVVPASGLVTALEPILRACGGTWIAQGSGDADRETADRDSKLRVPPEDPQYTLRRVWLTKEEEEGYYYGFSNKGLWPLCHIAHTRPEFRSDDWSHYQAANIKFAEAALQELEATEEPYILIQDYHFALLSRLIREKRPDARIAVFWHIPWPNPEAFGICPWQKELLDGLLGADLIGFHTQFHCNNFLDTIDRTLESRIDWQTFSVNRLGRTTRVKPFPISVAFPGNARRPEEHPGGETSKAALFKELGVNASYLGVGVDRIDYTKGILERFRGIERFLEKYPAYQRKLTFVELGEPSRTHIKEYRDLVGRVEEETDRINWRFQTKDWRPIVLLKGHHTHEEIQPFYRAADLCLVTSLHDGMNLVAKEFIAARDDEQGVLILSCFTGASNELQTALLINPYDIEQMAETIRAALEMEPEERRTRMLRLRSTVREYNIYRWAAILISELSQIQSETKQPAQAT